MNDLSPGGGPVGISYGKPMSITISQKSTLTAPEGKKVEMPYVMPGKSFPN